MAPLTQCVPTDPMQRTFQDSFYMFLPALYAEAESVFWDEHGRAWVRDAYGRCALKLDP